MHQGLHELLDSMLAWSMLYAGLGWAKGSHQQERGGFVTSGAGEEPKVVSPSVDTAHMVWWPDGDLEQILILFGTGNLLCYVNAMAQEHAPEVSVSVHRLAIHLYTACKHVTLLIEFSL